MDRLLEIASNIPTPIALAGFLAGAFLILAREVINKNIFPTLTKALSGTIIIVIINRVFVLALVAMVLGFISFTIPLVYNPSPKPDSLLEDKPKVFLVEDSAAGVNEVLSNYPEWDQQRAFNDLFKDRWTKSTGWTGIVEGLPRKSVNDYCDVLMVEDNVIKVLLKSVQQGCDLRSGDSVMVTGQLIEGDIKMLTLSSVIISPVSEPPAPPIAIEPKVSPAPPTCEYVLIKNLGWSSGHKTNFCISKGYDSNYNPFPDYSDGGFCYKGPSDVCQSQIDAVLQNR
jgi:hypothetical protein